MAFLENSPDASAEKKTGFTFNEKEIVLSKTRGHPKTGIRKRHGWYPDEKRIEVATLFACLGRVRQVAELAKISEYTIREWIKTPWFKELMEDIRSENNEILDAKFTQIAEKTQDAILDRLENGDFTLTKYGEQVRKPINARDLAIVGAVTIDKRQIIRNKPTSISQNIDSGEVNQDKLQRLAQTFIDLVNKKELKEVLPIEGVFEEVSTNASPPNAG